jgi:hypothetical protein
LPEVARERDAQPRLLTSRTAMREAPPRGAAFVANSASRLVPPAVATLARPLL